MASQTDSGSRGGEEVAALFHEMAGFMTSMLDSLPKMGGEHSLGDPAFEHMKEMNGFPVRTLEFGPVLIGSRYRVEHAPGQRHRMQLAQCSRQLDEIGVIVKVLRCPDVALDVLNEVRGFIEVKHRVGKTGFLALLLNGSLLGPRIQRRRPSVIRKGPGEHL